MATSRQDEAAMQADDAVNAALQAEREAAQAVAECERQAATITEDARMTAQRIDERTDARITKLHMRCARAVADKVDALLRQKAGTHQAAAMHLDDEVLAVAIERLAQRLTSGDAE